MKLQCAFLTIFFTTLILTLPMNAQHLQGEYRLSGVQDMASAFRFTKDGQFEFFMIYGAIDRQAAGTYTVEGNTVKLSSNKKVGQDFEINKQSAKGKDIQITVHAPNDYLRDYALALAVKDGQQQVFQPDASGTIQIASTDWDTIYMVHELYPDIPTLIRDISNPNTHFEVTLLPSLAEISFTGIDFTITPEGLTCLPSYVLPFEKILFRKE